MIGSTVGATAAAGVVVPVAIASQERSESDGETAVVSYPRSAIARISELAVGEPVWFDYPNTGDTSLLVKIGAPATAGVGPDGDVVAFSNRCTHMGCPIPDYQPDERVLGPCPCHFTTFDLSRDGQVTLGQATQNLPRVELELEGDSIFAVGVVHLLYGRADNLA